jgi:hypothetical protein
VSDANRKYPEEELMKCWQNTIIGSPDPGRLAQNMRAHIAVFDRKIVWRNFAEYGGCFVLLVWNGYDLLNGNRLASASIAAVLFVMIYLWWKHRGLKKLDPAMDARSYKTALLRRFDDQIRLLSQVVEPGEVLVSRSVVCDRPRGGGENVAAKSRRRPPGDGDRPCRLCVRCVVERGRGRRETERSSVSL